MTSTARAGKRWITLLLYIAIWAAVGMAFRQWEIFASMTIPMVSLGGGYIIGESWRPSQRAEIPQPRPTDPPEPPTPETG